MCHDHNICYRCSFIFLYSATIRSDYRLIVWFSIDPISLSASCYWFVLVLAFSLKLLCEHLLPCRAVSMAADFSRGEREKEYLVDKSSPPLLLPPQQDEWSSVKTRELVKTGVCCLMHVHLGSFNLGETWAGSCELDSPLWPRILSLHCE